MGLPREFMLTDVRCFEGEQRARLRPITLLIGENSTGKTTFLGCYSVMHRLFYRHRFLEFGGPDFNQEPFSMGSFSDIIRSKRSRLGRIDKFEIDLFVEKNKDNNMPSFLIRVTFSESASQPVISNIRYEFDPASYFDINHNEEDTFLIRTPYDTLKINSPGENWSFALFQLDQRIQFPAIGQLTDKPQDPTGEKALKYISELFMAPKMTDNSPDLIKFLVPYLPNLILLAPPRSKPKRTYDPVQETSSPDGSHIPMLMMRLNRTEEGKWRSLHDNLIAFGKHSGMFSDINVRRLG